MELDALCRYALDTYGIAEDHKWADFPGFSVLVDPETKKWAALLMRFWDTDLGEETQLADIRCGPLTPEEYRKYRLSPAFRMRSAKWVGVRFTRETDEETVCRLFDLALRRGRGAKPVRPARTAAQKDVDVTLNVEKRVGCTLSVDVPAGPGATLYTDTALPLPGSVNFDEARRLPEEILKMKRAYAYGDLSLSARAKNFYRQARLMENYEDDRPWTGTLRLPYPVYHDLRDDQLRGYFTWRTALRRGEWTAPPEAFAYIYVYELLHLVGAKSPEDAVQRLTDFLRRCEAEGYGDAAMLARLRRWRLGLAVTRGVPAEGLVSEEEAAKSALLTPDAVTDEALLASLCALSGVKLTQSPAFAAEQKDAPRLAAAVVRKALVLPGPGGRDLFTAVFGRRTTYPWEPFQGAVYDTDAKRGPDLRVELSPCRAFERKNGEWTEDGYAAVFFDKRPLTLLARELDRRLRLFYKTGRALKAKPDADWCKESIDAVLDEERRRLEEAKRPKLTIDFSDLSRIREDAEITKEALLTEADVFDDEATRSPAPAVSVAPSASPLPPGPAALPGDDLPLDETGRAILLSLLRGEDPADLVKGAGKPPSVVADELNEALFDELGDSAVDVDGPRLTLIEEYREELLSLFGG